MSNIKLLSSINMTFKKKIQKISLLQKTVLRLIAELLQDNVVG